MIPTLLKENQNHIVRPKKLMSSNPSHLSFEEILKLASERIKHHVPRQVGDLTGPQASLGGKQNDHTVAKGCRVQVAKIRRSWISLVESIFACLPGTVSR